MKEFIIDKTVFYIAHRLITIMDCDVIFVMDQGNIVESGSHDELLKLGGAYANLWSQQLHNSNSKVEKIII